MWKPVLVLVACLASFGARAEPQLTMCKGDFALCAAATCTPTGRTMVINGKSYPETVCNCPVLQGEALADLNGGNMQGSCARPSPDGVWSLFSYRAFVPQELNGWSSSPRKAKTRVQECSSELKLAAKSVNCFSMSCNNITKINGQKVAVCTCPAGESVSGGRIAPATDFLIQSGQGDPEYCGKSPVAVTAK